MSTIDHFNKIGGPGLPGTLGIEAVAFDGETVTLEMPVSAKLMAPNGYLHAASIVALADTAAGYGCQAHCPDNALGFTTVELKVNFLGTARDGTVMCESRAVHLGRQTQVWDTKVVHKESGKTMALFRCTQMLLYPTGS